MPRSGPTFYGDESIYSTLLVAALKSAGAAIEQVGAAVPFGSMDETWLAAAGTNGWIALTRDKRIRYRKLETLSLVRYGVGAFTFTGGNATARATSDRLIDLLPRMSAIAVSEPKPFLYTFGLNGPLSRVKLK